MKNLLFFLLFVLIISCKQEVKKEETTTVHVIETETIKDNSDPIQKENELINKVDYKNLLGYYVGRFQAKDYNNTGKNPSYTNKINISIDNIKEDSIFGHSVVAGNSRSFKGVFDTKTFFAKVFEPGDDKYDGVFEFFINSREDYIKGTWEANNKIAVTKREYSLEKKSFKYDSSLNLTGKSQQSLSSKQAELMDAGYRLEAIEPGDLKELNSSTQKLTNQDIENFNKGELEILRNLIYARHGYSFKNRKMRYFFDMKVDWYIPVSTDVRNALTDLEKENIELIKRYEQHAEKYYDYFGR